MGLTHGFVALPLRDVGVGGTTVSSDDVSAQTESHPYNGSGISMWLYQQYLRYMVLVSVGSYAIF